MEGGSERSMESEGELQEIDTQQEERWAQHFGDARDREGISDNNTARI